MKARDDSSVNKPVDTAHFSNPADQAAADEAAALLAAGGDPFGDFDDEPDPAAAKALAVQVDQTELGDGAVEPPSFTEPPAAKPVAKPVAKAKASEGDEGGNEGGDEGDEGDPAKDGPTAEQVPGTEPPVVEAPKQEAKQAQRENPYKAKTQTELDAVVAGLMAKRTEAFAAYSDGTMPASEYSAIDAEVMTGLMRAASEGALAQANAQIADKTSRTALDAVLSAATLEGLVDYSDAAAQAQFNGVIDMLESAPDAGSMSDQEIYSRAHSTVLMMRGLTPKQAASPPAPAPAPRKDMAAPLTLRNVPQASTPNSGGGVNEQLSRLQGQDFEEAIGRMPKAQRDDWLDS